MPTQLEKTAAFLKKIGAEGFTAPNVEQLMAAANDPSTPADQRALIMDAIGKAQTAGSGAPALNRVNDNYGVGGERLVNTPRSGPFKPDSRQAGLRDAAKSRATPAEGPGMLESIGNFAKAHPVATGAAAGATALLAGVLTYNMLKKKSKGNVTQMPGQRKVADEFSNPLYGDQGGQGEDPGAPKAEQPKTPAPLKESGRAVKAMKSFGRKAALPAALAATFAGGAAANEALGDDSSPADASGGKTWAGKTLGISTGSDVGDAAAGAGIVGLGAMGVYQLYKKLRGAA